MLINQLICGIKEINKCVAELSKQVKSICSQVASGKAVDQNHAMAICAIQNDIRGLKDLYDEINQQNNECCQSIFNLSETLIPLGAYEVTVPLPLGIRIISMLVKSATLMQTEEIGVSCYSVTANATNTMVLAQLIGVPNTGSFTLEINYINLTTPTI